MGEVGFVQRGYLALEEQGKAYRIDSEVLPTKFMNATLNEAEVGVLIGFAIGGYKKASSVWGSRVAPVLTERSGPEFALDSESPS